MSSVVTGLEFDRMETGRGGGAGLRYLNRILNCVDGLRVITDLETERVQLRESKSIIKASQEFHLVDRT